MRLDTSGSDGWAAPWTSTDETTLSLDGRPYFYRYLPAAWERTRSGERLVDPQGVQVSVALATPFQGSVLIVPEDGWDRAARALGLSPEFQTDVPDVDRRFMFSGRIGPGLGQFFRTPDVERRLNDLFEAGFTRIEFFGDRVTATARPWTLPMTTPEPRPEMRTAAAALVTLGAGIAFVPADELSRHPGFHHFLSSRKPASWSVAGVVAGLGCAFLLGLGGREVRGSELWARFAPMAFACAAAAVVAMALVMRRDAFRGRILAAVLGSLGVVVFVAGMAALTFANEALDTTPTVEHSVVVIHKWTTSGRSTSYYLRTRAWRPADTDEEFRVSRGLWSRAVAGTSRYVVDLRPGYFGVEWIVSSRLIE